MTYPIYGDDFNRSSINKVKWGLQQIKRRQVSFPGNGTIAITVTDGDSGLKCSKPCQRAELRTRRPFRPDQFDEFWHGFAFRASGDIAPVGSVRTILGQWKAPGDSSPFLAQRFDNGVFHITVQDGPCRRTVASAKGDPDQLERYQNLIAKLSRTDPETVHMSHALAELRTSQGVQPISTAGNSSSLHQSLRNNLETIGTLARDSDQKLFEKFCYIKDLRAYALPPKLKVTHPRSRKLPDPKRGWVHMAYRIRIGREDSNPEFSPRRRGKIDIYADGELIAKVRGDIGYKLAKPVSDSSIYFKFGIYRDVTPGTLNLHFDRFRQGATKAEVMP